MKPLVALLLCLLLFPQGVLLAQNAAAQQASQAQEHVRDAAHSLLATYDPSTGLFKGTGWWNSANGITALADVSRILQTYDFDGTFKTTFSVAPGKFPHFLNEYYDDEGWWALAWLDVYELRQDPRYLAVAQSIFTDMTGGWTDACGGGIWWKKDVHYKNAIANELFLSVATQLATVSTGDVKARYLDWARKEERWFLASGMVNGDSLINDGLDSSCHNNGKTTWSYNQGVILTGLATYSKLTGDTAALDTATRIAHAVSTHLTDSKGIVHDPCEPHCGDDGPQFKGILFRNLASLLQISPSPELSALVARNADSVWDHARTPAGHFSVDWAGPPQDSGTSSLISALDALTASLRLDDRKSGPGAH